MMKCGLPLLCQRRGFTIIELMVTIAIAAILLTIAAPSFQQLIKSNQVAAQNNELIAMIHLARSEAVRRNPLQDPVTVDLGTTANGWRGAVLAPGEDGLDECPDNAIRCSVHKNVDLEAVSGTFPLFFDNRGYSVDINGQPSGVTLSLEHRACQNTRHARIIAVLPGGQVSSTPKNCEGEG